MKVIIQEHNETFIRVEADRSVERELHDRFKYKAENYFFHPMYKKKLWDGNINFFNLGTQTIYKGLKDDVIKYLEESGYEVADNTRKPSGDFSKNSAAMFIWQLGIPYEARDYQIDSFVEAVNKERLLIVSSTGSGKSIVIYFLTRYYKEKVLIIVNTTTLVEQLYKDFEEYGYESSLYIKKLSQDYDKNLDGKNIVISTYQSLLKKPESWFKQFETIIVDEAHGAKSKSIVDIMTKCSHIKYRFGLTGTLSKTAINNVTLRGLFGDIYQATTTSQLIENKTLANLRIRGIVLKYNEETRKYFKQMKPEYQEEQKFIISHAKRNLFICRLAGSFKDQNTLVLYSRVDTHGKVLLKMFKKLYPDRPIYFVAGEVSAQERQKIRELTEKNKGVIIVASYQTFATGTNIVNLHNAILASSTKSRIRSLQSIGRILRKGLDKDSCMLYDITDDLSGSNHSYKHFKERLKIYKSEGFNVQLTNFQLEK